MGLRSFGTVRWFRCSVRERKVIIADRDTSQWLERETTARYVSSSRRESFLQENCSRLFVSGSSDDQKNTGALTRSPPTVSAGLAVAFRSFQFYLGVEISDLVDTVALSAIYSF